MTFRIRGCVEYYDVDDDSMQVKSVSYDEANFFGVYEVQKDGTDKWVADFDSADDAHLFAHVKGDGDV